MWPSPKSKVKQEPAVAPAAARQVAAQGSSPVDAAVQGTWMQMVPNPQGMSTWYWEIRPNGTIPNANTLVANGRLGTGYWHRRP